MRKNARWIVIVLVIAVIGALFLSLNPSGKSNDQGPSAPTASPVAIDITVAGGKVTGGGDVSVREGSQVTVSVKSDVADEVHIHGYDLHGDVAPGKPVDIIFTADAAGKFEIELESRALLLAELTVEP